MSIYAIGDIQGCLDEFRELLDTTGFNPAHDRIWLVGDLVNRGPDSLGTLRLISSLGDRVLTVLGNHDLHLLAVAAGVANPSKEDTLDAVLGAPDREELLDWLRFRELAHYEDGRLLVHAGLLPQWNVQFAVDLAAEVQAQLRSPDYRHFLAGLYGNKPDRWSGNLQGMDRWRVVVNAMTRLRFVSEQGVMEFASKGEVRDAPQGYLPWFEVPGRRTADTQIIFGHWSALGLKLTPTLAALDTGCVWGGSLTAMRLEDGVIFRVPSRAAAARHAG